MFLLNAIISVAKELVSEHPENRDYINQKMNK